MVLKTVAFSQTDASPVIRLLGKDEIDLLARLEQTAWPRALRASEEAIRQRLDLGHDYIIADFDGTAICAAGFVLTREDPRVADRFPATFDAFSSLPKTQPVMSAYVYNLCVDPAWRGHTWVFRVMDAVISFARSTGAAYVVGDGRCPSFNGSTDGGPNRVAFNPAFRATVEQWRKTGIKPDDTDLIVDPVLRFYRRYTDCRFLYLTPDFIPEDTASGGYRVIFAIDLTDPDAKF